MATKQELRQVVREEISKAERRLRQHAVKQRQLLAVGEDKPYAVKVNNIKRLRELIRRPKGNV